MIYKIRRSVGLNELKEAREKNIEKYKEFIRDNVDIRDLYHVDNFYYSTLYVNMKNGNILPLPTLAMSDDVLEYRNSYINDLIEKKDFEAIISLCDGQFALMCYEIIENLIPIEDKYKCFMCAYSRADFNFEGATENLKVDEILDYKRLDEDKIERLKDMYGDDLLTIYRGQGSMSASLEKAISWTTDIAVAERFAKYHNLAGDGVIYAAEVNLEDITDYITDRNEEEIIVSNYYLHNVRLFDDLKSK